jgi:hypothetical protein
VSVGLNSWAQLEMLDLNLRDMLLLKVFHKLSLFPGALKVHQMDAFNCYMHAPAYLKA